MNEGEIIARVRASIKILEDRDRWLLENDLSERSITHRLAYHLQHFFNGYNVDCEYNGAIRGEGYARKKVYAVKQELLNAELKLREIEKDFLADQLIERSAYPDIIVHKRGQNDDNLCIIEIKKTTSVVGMEYDEIKLRSYTRSELDNALCYQVGIFNEIKTGGDERDYSLMFCQNGGRLTQEGNDHEHN